MEPNQEIRLVSELLVLLHDRASYEWRNEGEDGDEALYELKEQCSEQVWGLTVEDLEAAAEDWAADLHVRVETTNPVYLPPLPGERNFVAALAIDWDFDDDPDGKQSIRVQMVRRNIDEEDRVENPFQTLCIHFDGANPGEGWMYYHTQLGQRQTGGFDWAYHEKPRWLPKEVPRVPLPVGRPVELLHCAVMSLYGTDPNVFGALQQRIEGVGRKKAIPLLRHVLERAEDLQGAQPAE